MNLPIDVFQTFNVTLMHVLFFISAVSNFVITALYFSIKEELGYLEIEYSFMKIEKQKLQNVCIDQNKYIMKISENYKKV